MAVLCELYTTHSYHSEEHGGAGSPPPYSSDPNKIARIPPAMCDHFVSPSLCVWPNLMGRSNANQSESYSIQHMEL